MDIPVLGSTVFLTILLTVGLFFFIRASVKDRTQILTLQAEGEQPTVLEQLQNYFVERSYRLAAVDAASNQVTYEGFVRPSLPLAIFLSLLAGVGMLCLALVLALLFPSAANILPVLGLLGPLAGFFYWNRAGRVETVALQVESLESENETPLNLVKVTAHRDELRELQRSLKFLPYEE
ncbi:cofactor assembly of complex C subunit B [Vacuolonema iberomarrocanum]|uniref:cofactor assembly of complex C subunit B n=1 Tax=Vacuolonema iberomarrocanum TaxID=3454632 RepID=UPI0019FCDFD3|nr:cofactor assembly of complex C subunit B [filamentous cyanobacterium LEGE 07170]